MRKVVLDIETVSTADLPKVGAYNYALHPSTKISIACWKYIDEDKIYTWVNRMYGERINPNLVALLKDVEDGKVKLISHNATFERRVLNEFCGTDLEPKHFIDTMVLSNIHRGPASLLQSARFFGIEAAKDTEGAALMKKMCIMLPTPVDKKAGKAVGYELEYGYVTDRQGTMLAFKYSKEAVERLVKYCQQDVITTDQLYKKLTSQRIVDRLGDFADEVFTGAIMTATMNDDGINMDRFLLERINDQRVALTAQLNEYSNKHFGVKSGNQRKAITDYLKEQGVIVKGVGSQDIKDYVKANPECKWGPILTKYASLSKTSLRKAEKAQKIMVKNRLYDQLHFCGASATGRWSSMGFQVQNLPRPSVSMEEALKPDGDPVSALRATLIPDTCEKFYVADLKQIELRMALWVSGYKELVDKMDKGHDLYTDFASSIFKVPMEEIKDTQRQIGKVCMLSLQYGGGPAKLQMICNQMPKINITLDQAKEYVKVYRTRFKQLVAFWKKYSLHPNKPVQSKVVELCSTRQLYYGGIQNDKYFDGRFWNNMWGGVFFQHRIQAECRDLLLIKMNEMYRKGYKLRLTVHDEVVISVDEKSAATVDADWRIAGKALTDKYWPGLALDSDTSFNERYYK